MEYRLDGMSPGSFEDLVQSISTLVIGAGVAVFGDGPDGGREVAYSGEMSYDTGSGPWRGYLVVQAKYRSRPLGSPSDGRWLLEQLRRELSHFDSRSRRHRPDYYIIATNVVLSPTEETGYRDRVAEELRKVRPSLRGFDIWDYDKICAFLNAHDGLRRSFAAWTTPGDVLAALRDSFEAATPSFDETLHSYLQKELLVDQYARLQQAGRDPEERVPIARVFVDLPVSATQSAAPPDEEEPHRGFVGSFVDSARDRFSGRAVSTGRGTPGASGRYTLIGGPGQGKTTIAQFVCQLFRTAIIKGRPEALTHEAADAIDRIESWCESDGLALPTARRFPVNVPLSDFASRLESVNGLLDYIAQHIGRRSGHEVSSSTMRQWLKAYPWLLVLDGLDEVPTSANRSEVLQAVQDLTVDIAELDADVMILATSRPQGYSGEFSPHLYEHQYLAPLAPDQAMVYGARLLNARYAHDEDHSRELLRRLRRASEHSATARLMSSPLQVTLMTALVERRGAPPEQRWALFDEYYRVMLRREQEREVPSARVLREHEGDIDAIHQRVGLLLQAETERGGAADARMSLDRLRSIVSKRLRDQGHSGRQLEELQAKIIEAAATRLVFLVGLQSGLVGFELRSLQEFMAAEALTDCPDDLVRERLSAIAPAIAWRNVLLFAAGKILRKREYLRDMLLGLCAELNESSTSGALASVRGGSVLAADILEDGSGRAHPQFSRSLAREALRLLEDGDEGNAERLARLYQDELGAPYRERLRKAIQLGGLEQGAAWRALRRLSNRQVNWATDLAEEHWPEDAARLEAVIEAVSDPVADEAFLPLVIRSLHRVSPLWLVGRSGLCKAIDAQRRCPTWFRPFVELLSYSVRSVPVALTLGEPRPFMAELELSLPSFETDSLTPLTEVSTIDSVHPDWLPLAAAARFGADPSPAALGDALDALRRWITHREGGDAASYCVRGFPWPISNAFFASASESDLSSLAERARTGGLGSPVDWLAAEDRWIADPVDFETTAATVPDEEWPFGPGIAYHGVPLATVACMTGVFTLFGSDVEIVRLLHRAYEREAEQRSKSALARLVVTFGVELAEGREEALPLSASETWMVVHDAAEFGFRVRHLKFLSSIAEEDTLVAVAGEMASALRIDTDSVPPPPSAQVVKALTAAVRRWGDLGSAVLLPFLSPRHASLMSVSHMADRDLTEVQRDALTLLELGRRMHVREERAVVDRIVDREEQGIPLAVHALRVVAALRGTTALDSFAVELYRALVEAQLPNARRARPAVERVVNRIAAYLDAERRAELGLAVFE